MNNFRTILKYLIIILLILLPVYIVGEMYENNKGKVDEKPKSYKNSYNKPIKTSLKKIRFIVMADSRGSDKGVNEKIIIKTMEQIKRLNPQPQFAIMPGDLVGGGTNYQILKGQIEYFKKLVTRYYQEGFFYPGIGNHEVNNGVDGEKAMSEVFSSYKANFLTGYNRSVYYLDKGDTRIFMLNSNHPNASGRIYNDQFIWLRKNIKPTTKHNIFLFHEPAYPTGPHVGSSLDSFPYERNKLWQVIDSSNSPLVFCGHEHFYSRRHINNAFNQTLKGTNFRFKKSIYQVTVGSFGAPLYSSFLRTENVDIPPILEYHFAVVDIINNKIKTTVYNIKGRIIDSFEIS